jgi:enoyl-CoA hydratase/carnithine racemase
MPDLVTIEKKDFVAHVRLNRPEKYNALNPDMFLAILEAGQALGRDKSVRAVVLSGAGKGFCAGLDFAAFQQMGTGQVPLDLFTRPFDNPANLAQQVAYVWKQIPSPVVAALHGVAYGGGLQIALGADIRLASPDATFSVLEIKWGLVPDMSGTQTLRDLVRLDVAKELVFTGKIVDARSAAELGLITRVCDDPLAEALDLAGTIAGKSPDAIAAGKKLLEATWHGPASEGLLQEEMLQRSVIGKHNQIESVMANFEKRAPQFQDREK